jgi:LacI family transcriptional regulator
MKVTLKDISELTGFSMNTVSRALKDKPNIAPETMKRIKTAAAKLGYVPDSIAQSLRNRKTFTIGLAATELDNPVRSSFVEKLRQQAARAGYQLLVTGLKANPMESIRNLLARNIDALTIGFLHGIPAEQEFWPLLKQAKAAGTAIALFGDIVTASVDNVMLNYSEMAYGITRHLLDTGRKKIVFIGKITPDAPRQKVYSQTMLNAGLDPEFISYGDGSLEAVENRVLEYLKDHKPDAIIAINDAIAIAVMSAVQKSGRRIPEDIAVAGFDNIDFARYMNPPLTSAGYDSNDLAAAIVRLVLKQLETPEAPAETVTLENNLFIRKSTYTYAE